MFLTTWELWVPIVIWNRFWDWKWVWRLLFIIKHKINQSTLTQFHSLQCNVLALSYGCCSLIWTWFLVSGWLFFLFHLIFFNISIDSGFPFMSECLRGKCHFYVVGPKTLLLKFLQSPFFVCFCLKGACFSFTALSLLHLQAKVFPYLEKCDCSYMQVVCHLVYLTLIY